MEGGKIQVVVYTLAPRLSLYAHLKYWYANMEVNLSYRQQRSAGNEASIKLLNNRILASFPGLLSPNVVEGLVKLLRRMTSGGRLEAWHFR